MIALAAVASKDSTPKQRRWIVTVALLLTTMCIFLYYIKSAGDLSKQIGSNVVQKSEISSIHQKENIDGDASTVRLEDAKSEKISSTEGKGSDVYVSGSEDRRSGAYMSIDEAKLKHPFCFSDEILDTDSEGRQYLNLNDYAVFVKNEDPYLEPAYDYTCFMMQSRFNCEYPAGQEPEDVATNYRLKLIKEGQVCDMAVLMRDIGGPTGVLEQLKKDNPSKKKWVFPLFGNSLLRQYWESMVCMWSDQITNMKVQKGGKSINNKELNALNKWRKGTGKFTLFTKDDAGSIVEGLDVMEYGCHGRYNIQGSFRPGVKAPPNSRMCQDNIAEVEFLGSIRVPYFYHSEVFGENLPGCFEMMGLNLDDVTSYVGLGGYLMEALEPVIAPLHVDEAVLKKSYEGSAPWIGKHQSKDLGRYFSAENPGINVLPDAHACMPGPSDDLSGFVMFAWLRGIGLKAGGRPGETPFVI